MADQQTVLVTGGAGYIGSHAVLALRAQGKRVVVIDNLSTGHRWAVPNDVPLVVGNVADQDLVSKAISEYGVGAVMHFAGSIVVPESIELPLKYYGNNTCATRNLIEASIKGGIENFVFSSTAAVYGIPDVVPAEETAQLEPINPYGASKLMSEWMLRDASQAHRLRYAALRYFNVAGADPEMRTGQSTPAATHLIKVAVQRALGLRVTMKIFGDDYPTPDGTCIRDYIHVSDLAEAHVVVLDHMLRTKESVVANCGYGHGYSVKEVLSAVERVTERSLGAEIAERRAGDPPELVSSNRRIKEIGWEPEHDDLNFIVQTAFEWEEQLSRSHPELVA